MKDLFVAKIIMVLYLEKRKAVKVARNIAGASWISEENRVNSFKWLKHVMYLASQKGKIKKERRKKAEFKW